MSTTPSASAAQTGFPGAPDAVNASAQVNQLLGTHNITTVYGGNRLVAASAGNSGTQGSFDWISPSADPGLATDIGLPDYDIDAPFVLPSGTAIGRIEMAVLPVGIGADLQVTLCPDNGSGAPNTASPLASTVIPAQWVMALTAPDGLDTGGPLAAPRFNTVFGGFGTGYPWAQPAVSPTGAAAYATPVTSGSYLILVGGISGAGSTIGLPNVAAIQYLGDQTLSGPVPQPPLPQGAFYLMAAASDTMVMAVGGLSSGTYFANTWTASWDPNTGTIGAWAAQAPLPVPSGATGIIQGAAVNWGDVVYVLGGSTTNFSAQATSNVWYASAVNGQIAEWLAGPPLPQALQCVFAAVVGDWLIVAGGQTTTNATSAATYYAPINPDGSLGGWRIGPDLPTPVFNGSVGWNTATTDSQMIIPGGLITGDDGSTVTQILTVTADGISGWQTQVQLRAAAQCGAFANGTPGAWDLVGLAPTEYFGITMSPVPMLSVPLPASGLTAGATYHVVVHQIGGDLNNYLQLGEFQNTTPSWQYAASGSGGPWTPATGQGVVVNVYDQTPTGQPLHTWTDPNAAGLASSASTFVRDSTDRLLGHLDATAFVTQPGEAPHYLPSVAQLVYTGDAGMPAGIIQLA